MAYRPPFWQPSTENPDADDCLDGILNYFYHHQDITKNIISKYDLLTLLKLYETSSKRIFSRSYELHSTTEVEKLEFSQSQQKVESAFITYLDDLIQKKKSEQKPSKFKLFKSNRIIKTILEDFWSMYYHSHYSTEKMLSITHCSSDRFKNQLRKMDIEGLRRLNMKLDSFSPSCEGTWTIADIIGEKRIEQGIDNLINPKKNEPLLNKSHSFKRFVSFLDNITNILSFGAITVIFFKLPPFDFISVEGFAIALKIFFWIISFGLYMYIKRIILLICEQANPLIPHLILLIMTAIFTLVALIL